MRSPDRSRQQFMPANRGLQSVPILAAPSIDTGPSDAVSAGTMLLENVSALAGLRSRPRHRPGYTRSCSWSSTPPRRPCRGRRQVRWIRPSSARWCRRMPAEASQMRWRRDAWATSGRD